MKPCQCVCGCQESTGLTKTFEVRPSAVLSPGSDVDDLESSQEERAHCFNCYCGLHLRPPTEEDMAEAMERMADRDRGIFLNAVRREVCRVMPRVYNGEVG